jgi:hypothetical protein
MHTDTVTRSWGPLSCHSSATITTCFSMIMHGPMSQGPVHNYWNLKLYQFFHGLYSHQTCHPLSPFGMTWMMYDSVFQFPPKSSNFLAQHSTGHNQQLVQLYAKEMCHAWGKWSHQIVTGFLVHAPTSFVKVSVQMYICIPSPEIHRLEPNTCISIGWFPNMNCT